MNEPDRLFSAPKRRFTAQDMSYCDQGAAFALSENSVKRMFASRYIVLDLVVDRFIAMAFTFRSCKNRTIG